MSQLKLTRHSHGISAVDAEYVRPGLAAAHIIQEKGRAAFVDVGTTHSIPYLLTALDVLGIARESVDYILLTHVHLDHAGGAGKLLQSLPNARVVLHPRGAPHLIEPAKLIAGSIAVYGDALYRQLYGEIGPLPAERVVVTHDMQRLSLAGRELEFVHTPGHALHHHCIVDLAHASIFTGDTFGMSYREFDTERGAFIIPTTTPTQFDPEQLVASIDRLLAYRPEAMYLMHYSRVTDVPRLGESLKAQVRQLAQIARRHAQGEGRKEAMIGEMRAMWHELLAEHRCKLSVEHIDLLLETDLELNAQGMVAWIDRQKAR